MIIKQHKLGEEVFLSEQVARSEDYRVTVWLHVMLLNKPVTYFRVCWEPFAMMDRYEDFTNYDDAMACAHKFDKGVA